MQWLDLLPTGLSTLFALFSCGVFYGITQTQMKQLDQDLKRLEEGTKKLIDLYVTYKHFDAVIGRMQSNQDEMSRDIKQILSHVSRQPVS